MTTGLSSKAWPGVQISHAPRGATDTPRRAFRRAHFEGCFLAPTGAGGDSMKPGLAKAALPEPRKRLVELMQDLNFGRIEGLVLRDGEPVVDPLPCRRREVEFCSENGPRPELVIEDFVLKAQIVELFDCFDRLQNGSIDAIEVKHGLPFRMIVTEVVA